MFKTCIIDPPWPYERASKNEKLSGYVTQDNNTKYATLSIADLAALPVGSAVSHYLFMWCTGPFIREALQLFDAWGFKYVTQLCWRKSTGIGVGFWFRGDHELILVGKKPDVPSVRCTRVRSLFSAPRTRHSEKPDNLHVIIEDNFEGPYLEIFARKQRTGWTALGNEAPGDGADIRDSLPKLITEGKIVDITTVL